MNQDKILQKALGVFGIDKQEDILIEELSEVIQAVCKKRRYPNDSEVKRNFFEELADVKIMIRQMELYYGTQEIQRWEEIKINALEKMLEVK